VVADVAADVQASVAAEQVPAIGNVIALGDLDVAAGAAGRLQAEGGGLVVAALRIDDRVGNAGARLVGRDLPAAVAEVGLVGAVIHAGADAGCRARKAQL